MIAGLNTSFVSAVSLLGCCVPDQIILTFVIRPGWELDFLDTERIGNIGDDDIKTACVWIIVLDFQSSFGLSGQTELGATHTD